MKTKIQGGYVVAFDGQGHKVIQDGMVVYENDTIVHVGKSYDGDVDQTIDARGQIVSPGFINIHALASICITHLRLDGYRHALNRSRQYVVDGVGNLDFVGEDLEIASRFCYAELLKGGGTTSVTITAMGPSRWEAPREQAQVFARTAGELGARTYVSHHYRSAVTYLQRKEDTQPTWTWRPAEPAWRNGRSFPRST